MTTFTTNDIYNLSKETTELQFNNLFFLFNDAEVEKFNIIIKLGDNKFIALWTVISERYNKIDNYKELFNAYCY